MDRSRRLSELAHKRQEAVSFERMGCRKVLASLKTLMGK
jgi:hypothetical protein